LVPMTSMAIPMPVFTADRYLGFIPLFVTAPKMLPPRTARKFNNIANIVLDRLSVLLFRRESKTKIAYIHGEYPKKIVFSPLKI